MPEWSREVDENGDQVPLREPAMTSDNNPVLTPAEYVAILRDTRSALYPHAQTIADLIEQLEADKFALADTVKALTHRVEGQVSKLAKQQAIIDKLPKTADGVTVSGGDIVYDEGGDEMIVMYEACSDPLSDRPGGGWHAVLIHGGRVVHSHGSDVDCCYSTREAAEKARKE